MPPRDEHGLHTIRQARPKRHAGPSTPKRTLSWGALAWTTLSLSITLYILTTLYAWHPEVVSKYALFGGSPAKALRVLSNLSMVANFLLGAAIAQSFDLVRGMLIARKVGLCLLSNLALQPGTGLDGHYEIVTTTNQAGWKPRAWSILRVTSMTVIPILGIAILNDVEPVQAFYQTTSEPVTKGYGVGEFNATLAPLLQPMADALFGTRFKDFSSDADLVIGLSSDEDRKACSMSIPNSTQAACQTRYFVPGGVEQFASKLLANEKFSRHDDIQPVLAKNHMGYYFEFQEGHSVIFDEYTDCVKHGFVLGAYQLCLKDVGNQSTAAFLTTCPKSLAANLSCLSNQAWPLEEGWGTTFSTYSRAANVAYNGLNGTILTHRFPDNTLTSVDITAPQLLQVFKTLFSPPDKNSTFGSKLALLGLGNNTPAEPLIIWEYFQGLVELSKSDPRANRKAMIGLQALLMIPIYHCQAKDFIELRKLLLSQVDNSAIGKNLASEIVDLFPDVEPRTDIYPAEMRYTLRVGRGSLLAYIVLAGSSLVACVVVSIIASATKSGRKARNMGAFPLLTHMCDCEMTHVRREVSLEEFKGLKRKERLNKSAATRVILANNDSEGVDMVEEPREAAGKRTENKGVIEISERPYHVRTA